jgi:hypothetical protein
VLKTLQLLELVNLRPAKVLNFDSKSPESAQNNPPQRGVIDEAKTRPAETTPTRDETEPFIGMPEQQYKEQAKEQEIGDLPDIEL